LKIKVEKLKPWTRLCDKLYLPIMFLVGGFKADSIQETHPWHIQKLNHQLIDAEKASPIFRGNDKSVFKKHAIFLFHMPILGGWRDYSIYEIDENAPTPFNVGWIEISPEHPNPSVFVNKLPIYERKIRLLDGSSLYQMAVFAVSKDGRQIPVTRVGGGKLGENKDSDIRLF